MADTKAMAEVKALENFYSILQTEPSRAFYGLNHVLKANEGQAIDTLLVSDNLFRYSKYFQILNPNLTIRCFCKDRKALKNEENMLH